MADQTVLCGEGFIVERRVEHRGREVGAQRAADLNGLDRATRSRAATDVIDKFAKRDAECDFEQTAMLDVASKLNRDGAPRTAHAEVAVMLRPLVHDRSAEHTSELHSREKLGCRR